MEQGEQEASMRARKNRNLTVAAALVAASIVAVVLPTVALTQKHDSDNNGENAVELSDLVQDAVLSEHRGVFRGDDVLLSDLYSSYDLPENSIDDILVPDSNSSNATLLNNSLSQSSSAFATNSPSDVEDEDLIGIDTDAPTESLPTGSPTTGSPTTESPTTESPTGTSAPQPQIAKAIDSYEVLETISHDTNAFTQGLTFDPQNSDFVYESTGLYGESDVRKVSMTNGDVLMMEPTPSEIFGEGLAYYTEETENNPSAGRLIHITWKSQRGFIFDAETLETITEFNYSTQRNQGWGITHNPNTDQFIVTDGSNYLHFWDRDLTEVARIPVTIQVAEPTEPIPVTNLNEIEWDDETQTVLSNVWQTDTIVRIDPVTGSVVTIYNLSQLYTDRELGSDVLNGIAISPNKDLWVTGKKWPNMYRIVFNE